MSFSEEYKNAMKTVKLDERKVEDIVKKIETRQKKHTIHFIKPVTVAAACLLCFCVTLPVSAKTKGIYRIIESISPALADTFVPLEERSISNGIAMEVEAVHVDGNQADLLVSFSDAGDTDYIHGKVDTYDSYYFKSYDVESTIGGQQVLDYDAESDKAYLRFSLQADGNFNKDKMTLSVKELLCNLTKEERDINLSGIKDPMELKQVEINGWGSGQIDEIDELPTEIPYTMEGEMEYGMAKFMVCDGLTAKDCAGDDITTTAVAMKDGVLRVQMCMGDVATTDRHVELFLVGADGTERYEDFSVTWNEKIGDSRYQFYEFYYWNNVEDMENARMYGIFHDGGDALFGDWNITFRVQ